MSIHDFGDGRCYLFGIGGIVTRQDIEDSLRCCAEAGFTEATEQRHSKIWSYDLTSQSFKRKKL